MLIRYSADIRLIFAQYSLNIRSIFHMGRDSPLRIEKGVER